MDYEDLKDLPRRAISDKVQHDKSFIIAKYTKYDGYQRSLSSMVYKLFVKNSAMHTDISANGGAIKSEILSNQQSETHLADGLQKTNH